MAKRLNVNLAFTADTGKAKAQIIDLQKSLDNLITGTAKSGELGLTKDLVKAQSAAADLKIALEGALTPTGSIDLSKLDDGLKRSGKKLHDYRAQLEKLGPQGQETFMKLAQSIISAEAPLKRTNKLLDEFKTTLANTARWQLSSSLLHGFMGSLQSAYGYAQDLNSSLNDIRIVSGLSSAEMSKFADEANKAARALSTTTTAYTNAALIFYQQGLTDSAVKERTDAVIKMANVTKDSEDEVSSYMTAIWNNFEGEKANLESYADVIAALGAATASSSAEIAGGLEKFAAIGQQIGLSYDYATTALATVVANTRQSEEVVGTAFKTIFARIQGLNLGETLDDGTTLNKYSQALKAVGIDIKDATGELKDMDVILDEMGSKWQTLGRDQQVALAQTVAGVRQYNQLIALMDAWGTDFQNNLTVAKNSTGALQDQADIYAESWEAAQERVKAASEAIYSDLLNDDFFIGVLNSVEKILVGVDKLIDSMGGLAGILPGIGVLLTKMYGESMAKGINNMIFNVERNTEAFKQQQAILRQNAFDELMAINANAGTELGEEKINSIKIQTQLQKELYDAAQKLTAEDTQDLQRRLDIVAACRSQVEQMAKLKDDKSDSLQDTRQGMMRKVQRGGGSTKAARQGLKDIQMMEAAATQAKAELERLDKEFGGSNTNLKAYSEGLIKIQKNLINAGFDKTSGTVKSLNNAIGKSKKDVAGFAATMKELIQNGEFADRTFIDIDEAATALGQQFNWTTAELDEFRQKVAEFTQAGMNLDQAISAAGESVNKFREQVDKSQSAIAAMGTTGESIVRIFSGMSQAVMGISTLGSIMDTLTNPDTSALEKLQSVTTSLLMGIPALIAGYKALKTACLDLNTAALAQGAIESKNLLIKGVAISAKWMETMATKLQTSAIWGEVAAKVASLAASAPLLAVTLLLVAAMVGLAAIVALVVAVVKGLSDAYNADSIAAEKAAAAAKGLAEAFDEAKAHYEDMVSSMEKYQTARDSLAQLTEGTEEYRQALKEANDEALNLINKTSSLNRGSDYNWENGQLIISDEAMDRVKKEESERVSMAEASALMADARARQLSAKSNTTNLVRSDDVNGWAAVGAGAGTGAAIGGGLALGGVVTAVTAPVAAAIGGLIGGIVGGVTAGATNAADNAEEEERVQELTDLYRTMGEEAFDAAKLEELGFDTANKAYINSIKDIVKETIAAEEQLSNAARMAADITMSENESYANSEHQDKIAEVGGRLQEDLYQEAYDKYFKQTQNDDIFGVGSAENKQAMQAYAQQMGLDQLNGYKVTNFKKGGNVEYEYIDEEGKKQTKEVTREQIAMQLAAAEAAEKLGAQTDKLVAKFNQLEDSSNKADQALSDFLGGDLTQASKQEFDTMASELNVEAGGTIDETQAEAYLDQKFGDGKDGKISDETAKQYGYESAAAMRKAFMEEFNNNSAAWESVNVPEALSDSIAEGLSLKTAQALENNLADINAGPAGEAAGEKFVEGLNTMLADVDADDQQAAMKALMDIDWSSWDAMEQADRILKEFNVDIDTSSEEWQQFAQDMRIAAGATPDFSTLKTDLNEISSILNDLDFGSIIKEEDYQKLVAYNDEWERFFMLQADGSRKFIGNADDMRKQTRNDIRAQREALRERMAAQEGFKNANWGHKDDAGNWVKADWANKSGTDTGSAKNLMNATGATEDMLELLGYSDDVIQKMITNVGAGDEKAIADLKEMYTRMAEFEDEQLADQDAQFDEMLASTAANLQELNDMSNEISSEAYDKQLSVLASSATSLQELQDLAKAGLDAEDYLESLERLAGEYENCTSELEAYKLALVSGNDDMINAAVDSLEASVMAGEMAEQYGLAADELDDYAKRLAKSQGLSAASATRLAAANMRLDKGISNLNDNLEDYKKGLRDSNKGSAEWSRTLSDLKTDLADVAGVADGEMLSDTFAEAMLESEDLQKALDGDADAILRIRAAAAEDIVATIKTNLEGEDLSTFTSEWESVKSIIESQDINAPGFDQTELINSFNEMITAGNMTKEQIEAALSGLNVGADLEVSYNKVTHSVPTYDEYSQSQIVEPAQYDENGTLVKPATWKRSTWTVAGEPTEAEEFIPQYTLKGTEGEGGVTTGITQLPKPQVSRESTTSGKAEDGGNTKEPKKVNKKKASETDRYHVITEQLDEMEKALNRVSKAKDRAFGSQKLKLMDEEIAREDAMIKKNQEYADQVQDNLDAERAALEALGATFDENGVITNYDQLMQNSQAYKDYNKGVDYYNGLSAQEQEELDKYWSGQTNADGEYYSGYIGMLDDILSKSDEELQKLVENYEGDQDKLQEILDGIKDRQEANFDREMAKIDYVVEVKLDVDDRDIKHLEFLLEMIEDKDFNAAEAIANIGQQVDNTLSKIDTYKQGINDILGKVGKGYTADDLLNGNVTLDQLAEEGLTEEGLAQLEGYINGLAEENAALREMRANAWAQVSEEFNEYIEKMDSGIEKIEHLKRITESYKNIVDIVGKKFLGVSNDLLDKMNEATVKQSTDLLEANKAKMEAVQAAYDELLSTDTSGWSEQAKKQREEQLKEMEAELQGVKEAFMSSWEEALQASADRYAAAVDNIISEFEDSIAGLYGTLDELQEAFDRAQDLNSQYVEDYEQIYELTKLTRDINKYIDDTDNLEAKAAYRDYLKEINEELESGKQLSEYDIQYRQKKLELIQAEMALKEAKTAKSSVSMVRGEDGNYSYMYTASDEDVANAEQNYEDKLFEMQQLNGDYINNLQEQIIQTQAECAQALAAIKESDFNSYEEWRAAVDRTQDFYNQKLDFYYSQLDGTLSNNRNLYENDWTRYSEATGYKISSDEQFVDRFNETSYALVTGFQTREEAQNAWNIASDQMLVDLATAYTTWQSEIETIMGAAGTSVEGFAKTMEEQTDRNVEDSEKAKKAVNETAESMQEDFANTISKIVEWETTWGTKVDAVIAKNTALITSYNALKQAMADALGGEDGSGGGGDSGDGDGGSGGGDSGNGGGSGSGGGNAVDNSDKAAGVAAAIWMEGGAGSGWGNDPTRSQRLNEKGVASAQSYINAHGPNGDIYREWSKKRNQLQNFHYGSFDTGGYTGDWGDKSGRLALLHSKEIVLNAEDTKNFLSAIELVREIANIIDLNAAAASGAFGVLSSATSVRGGEREIVQQIEIHAEFPDANNHNEIELAFNNLLNAASQYANRDK